MAGPVGFDAMTGALPMGGTFSVIFPLASTAALISLVAYFANACLGPNGAVYRSTRDVRPSVGDAAFLLLAASGLLTCFFAGARVMLYWMPSNWGTVTEDGEFQSTSTYVALLLASGGVFVIGFITNSVRDKVKVRALTEECQGLREILKASVDDRWLAELEQSYREQAEQIRDRKPRRSPEITDADVRRYVGPEDEKLATLEDLIVEAAAQRVRLTRGRESGVILSGVSTRR